jgi:hypothetical protein
MKKSSTHYFIDLSFCIVFSCAGARTLRLSPGEARRGLHSNARRHNARNSILPY